MTSRLLDVHRNEGFEREDGKNHGLHHETAIDDGTETFTRSRPIRVPTGFSSTWKLKANRWSVGSGEDPPNTNRVIGLVSGDSLQFNLHVSFYPTT